MTAHAVRRLNSLLECFEAPSYLEIGVFKGLTFFDIKAASKVAVDPKFQFEVPAPQEGVDFHQVTSDAYFSSLSNDAVFDVVFLDGLHVFEQTFRDFCNTLSHTHADSIIVLDDTVPCDPYSALRDQATAVHQRSNHGDASRAWHGDTYKVVMAIHDFFPAYSYATVMDDGNPQTVVWRENRVNTPAFPDMEAISRMDYFGFRDRLDVLKPVSRAEMQKLIDDRRAGRQA